MESSYSASTRPHWTHRISIAGFLQRPKELRQLVKARSTLVSSASKRGLRDRSIAAAAGDDSKTLRTTLMLAMFGYAAATSGATYQWQKDVLIPVGLEPQSETVLRMPESISKYYPENDSAVSISEVDARTLTIKPLASETEQRLFVRGESGKLYVAKLSTRLRHVAVIEVQDASAGTVATPAARASGSVSPAYLMVQMIRNATVPGFSVLPWAREILAGDEFVITGEQVWSSPRMTGVIARITRATGVSKAVQINPAAIQIAIPAFGQLRLITADRWILDNSADRAVAQLIFTRD